MILEIAGWRYEINQIYSTWKSVRKTATKFARMGTYTKTYTPKRTTQHEKEVAGECFLEVAEAGDLRKRSLLIFAS